MPKVEQEEVDLPSNPLHFLCTHYSTNPTPLYLEPPRCPTCDCEPAAELRSVSSSSSSRMGDRAHPRTCLFRTRPILSMGNRGIAQVMEGDEGEGERGRDADRQGREKGGRGKGGREGDHKEQRGGGRGGLYQQYS
jgi:hypothetical protein